MKIFAESGRLVVQLEGWEKVWSLKNRVEIPRDAIANLELIAESPKKNFALPFIKFPGTVLPGILLAGSFVKRGERDFWYLRVHHPGVLDIQTKPGSFNYNRLLLSCDAKTASDIGRWWKA